jgi:RNA polymerase sigma-70 factor (ECF subfamily)
MSGNDSASSTPASFPPTDWSRIRILQDPGHPEHKPVLDRFVTVYWKPVFYFLRTRGCPFQEAQDLTQEFFLRLTLEGDWIRRADPERGRFRNFLRKILCRFVADHRAGRTTRQKDFERQVVSLHGLMSDEERTYEPAAGLTAEEVFDRRWAADVMNHVLENLRRLSAGPDRQGWYEIFEAYCAPEDKRPSQDTLAERLGLSRDRVQVILRRMRAHFDRLLRAEIREQVGGEAEVDDEIRELQRLLGR